MRRARPCSRSTRPAGEAATTTSTDSAESRAGSDRSPRRRAADRGAPFDDEPHPIARMPDHELWMTFFRDPDRNLHGLMAEVS
jgi:hypothetical protein